jgi:ketosteroid isomerase-like protein
VHQRNQHSCSTNLTFSACRARRYFECLNTRDVPRLLDLVADDCVHHVLAYDSPVRGKPALRIFYINFLQNVPEDVRFVIEDVTEGSDLAVGIVWCVLLHADVSPDAHTIIYEARRAVRELKHHFKRSILCGRTPRQGVSNLEGAVPLRCARACMSVNQSINRLSRVRLTHSTPPASLLTQLCMHVCTGKVDAGVQLIGCLAPHQWY